MGKHTRQIGSLSVVRLGWTRPKLDTFCDIGGCVGKFGKCFPSHHWQIFYLNLQKRIKFLFFPYLTWVCLHWDNKYLFFNALAFMYVHIWKTQNFVCILSMIRIDWTQTAPVEYLVFTISIKYMAVHSWARKILLL